MRALVKELRTRKRAAMKHSPQPTGASRSEAERTKAEGASERESSAGKAAPERVSRVASDAASDPRCSRHVPAQTRRAVFDRDGARCAYHDDRGERCHETAGLEVHHRHAYALGGPATLDNLELRCRAHNTLAAEEDFGRRRMARMRGVNDDAAPERGPIAVCERRCCAFDA